jgi:hypothetical protein
MAPVQRRGPFRVCARIRRGKRKEQRHASCVAWFCGFKRRAHRFYPTLALDRALVGTPTAPADRFGASPGFRGDLCRETRRGGRDVCRSDVVMDWYGGEWALYNNRSWAPDSYNDWWHDRPDRPIRRGCGTTRAARANGTLRTLCAAELIDGR